MGSVLSTDASFSLLKYENWFYIVLKHTVYKKNLTHILRFSYPYGPTYTQHTQHTHQTQPTDFPALEHQGHSGDLSLYQTITNVTCAASRP